jgi:hypothetical protein
MWQKPGLQMEVAETESDTDLVCNQDCQLQLHISLVWTPPGQLSNDMQKHVLAKIVKNEHGENEYPTRQCRVCSSQKETCGTSASSAWCHSTKRNTVFPETSHSQAPLGALVFPKNISS